MVIPEIGVSGGFPGSGFTTCGGGGGGCSSDRSSPSSPQNILPVPSNHLENEQAESRYVIKEENDTAAECVGEPASSSSSMIEPVTAKVEAEEGFEDEVEEQDTAGEINGCGGVDDGNNVHDSNGNDTGNSGPPSSCSSVVLPKPMEGLHDASPPPFLRKTFEMVEDPESDCFVVWDSHEFSKNLLPRYFKHGNFSSFIRQLNTYGFRKINQDMWEFANEGFQGGKKHLLKIIVSQMNKKNIASSSLMIVETTPISVSQNPSESTQIVNFGESSSSYCEICDEREGFEEMFKIEGCVHSFCCDCISKHVSSKIESSSSTVVTCLMPKCRLSLNWMLVRPFWVGQ